jgi:N-acetylneuraminic acid mutarotase
MAVATAIALIVGLWQAVAPIPHQRSELGAAVIAGQIYIVAGFEGGNLLERYDPATDTWELLANLPIEINHPAVTAYGGKLYVFGGYLNSDLTAVANAWSYDLETNEWTAIADLPVARGALGAAVVGDRIYVIGGAEDALGGPATGAVDIYDPVTDSWSSGAALPTPREHLAVVALDDRIYAIGGRANGDEDDRFAGANEIYDPTVDSWSTGTALPVPRGGLSGVAVAGRVVVLGGERGTTAFADVNAYDPLNDMWEALPPMSIERHGLAAVATDETIFAITGSTAAGKVENTDLAETLTVHQ